MSTFKINVVTHIKKVIDQEADYLRIRTTEGDLGILANHAPLVAELSMGPMEIKKNDKKDLYFLSGGFLEISNNQVTIIADKIIHGNKIDYEKVEKEAEEARNILKKYSKEDKEFLMAEQKLKESLLLMSMKKYK